MPPGQPPPFRSADADLPQELRWVGSSTSPSPAQKGGRGIRDTVSTTSLCNSLGLVLKTLKTPTWPLLRRRSAAASGRRLRGDGTATHTHTGLLDGTCHPRRSQVHQRSPVPEPGWPEEPLTSFRPHAYRLATSPPHPIFRPLPARPSPPCPHARDRHPRHNATAHVFWEAAQEAGLWPQKKKASLLQPCPDSDGLPPIMTVLPTFGFFRIPDVWDFEVTSLPPPNTEPGRVRDPQEDIARHSHSMPSERPPLHPIGF